MHPEAVQRLHVFIEGGVQGVGFRYSTYHQAQTMGLAGWVRNLDDGRVEAVFEGPRTTLDQMLLWCRQGSPFSQVARVVESWETGSAQYADFTVRG